MKLTASLMSIMLFATSTRAAEGIPFLAPRAAHCQDVFDTCDAAIGALKSHIDTQDMVIVDLQREVAVMTKKSNDEANALHAWYRAPVTLVLTGLLIGLVVKK